MGLLHPTAEGTLPPNTHYLSTFKFFSEYGKFNLQGRNSGAAAGKAAK
jgi:hypothetical protein